MTSNIQTIRHNHCTIWQMASCRITAFSLLCLLCLGLLVTQPVHAETDARAVTKQQSKAVFNRLSNANNARFALASKSCLQPGDLLTIEGDNLTGLDHYHMVLRGNRTYIPLNQLSISKQKIILQVPHNTDLKPDQLYPVLMLLATEGASVSKETGTTIKICPAITAKTFLPILEKAHESGEYLVLAHSGLVDSVLSQSAKLGYILLRRHQLSSVNLSLMVFGGSEKNLDKTIKTLASTFPDIVVDYNHHYFTSGAASTAQPAVRDHSMPTYCDFKPDSKVIVGMLDGDLDMSHPALAGKNIKTKNFLIPGEPVEQEHATAIAAMLVGTNNSGDFGGFVPFISLKAAKVVTIKNNTQIATAESVTRALDWFMNEQVRLVSVSLTSSSANKIANSVFKLASEHGLIIFAAAGNDRRRLTPSYPAALPYVITITAVDAEGEVYSDANQGKYIDFAAPGVNIWTASVNNKGQFRSGTSLAVPHAVSIAALYLAHQPNYSQEALYQNLQHQAVDLGRKGYDSRYGWGEIQVQADLCQPIL